jgi:hypothetical protein
MSKKDYQLPDGTWVDEKKYFAGWDKISDPLKKLGLVRTAFDPDVCFTFEGHYITLPVWFLNVINLALKNAKK